MKRQHLVIPTAIPFERLRSRELEECVYWLLDSMGAKELVWRLGTHGASAADQGRDIEALFPTSSPDAEIVLQRWWVECKGRQTTVEASAVKESANNTSAASGVDVLVIVTNTAFSNPTRNWVKQWQESRPRPMIKLWDKTDLERLLCRYPAATLRLFSKALTPQGKLEVMRERFWQHTSYATRMNLEELWVKRDALEWDSLAILAAVVSEFASGSISKRAWPLACGFDGLLELLGTGLANTLSFCIRAEEAGIEQGPYIDAVGYLILLALTQFPAEAVRFVLENFLDLPDTYKAEGQALALAPILNCLAANVRNACTRDCVRVSLDLAGPPDETAEHYAEHYWDGLVAAKESSETDLKSRWPNLRRYSLTLEDSTKPCKVGFELNREVGCPLLHLTNQDGGSPDLARITTVLKKVVTERVKDASVSANSSTPLKVSTDRPRPRSRQGSKK